MTDPQLLPISWVGRKDIDGDSEVPLNQKPQQMCLLELGRKERLFPILHTAREVGCNYYFQTIKSNKSLVIWNECVKDSELK